MRPISQLADRDDAIAFAAFHSFASPALRDVARGPLSRARHAGRACCAPTGSRWCAECEATIDDLLLESFGRLRAALTGAGPVTSSGQPVREMVLVCEHLMSPGARDEDAAAWGIRLRSSGGGDEPTWLRAAGAQLVHYPLRHLEERTRRADAVRRGASARPDRDLRQAAWAACLRDDPAGLEMLILVVFRIRRRVSDPFEVPDDLRERHGLTPVEASRRMAVSLAALRTANPGFFAANIAEPVDGSAVMPTADPLHGLVTDAERDQARATLGRLCTTRAAEQEPLAMRRETYRRVVAAVCAAGAGRSADPVALAECEFGIASVQAERMVRRFAVLVATAGVEWAGRVADEVPAESAGR